MFGAVLTIAYTLLLGCVLWRASTLPMLRSESRRRWLLIAGAVLWLAFVLGRFIGHDGTGSASAALEFVGMSLLGWVFLSFIVLLAIDIVTLFGRLVPTWKTRIRATGLAAGLILSAVALVQGVRSPAVVSHEVVLPNLPAELGGTVIAAVSDAHLGTQLGEEWFADCIEQIQGLHPDVVVFLGDMFEGHGDTPKQMEALQRLPAPLGKWFVEGNHESHRHGASRRRPVLEQAGFRQLDNASVELAPGLVLAGVTDLTTHKRRNHDGDPLGQALSGRPDGATVLLSHSPWHVQRAARDGVGLMLSGHTPGARSGRSDTLSRGSIRFWLAGTTSMG